MRRRKEGADPVDKYVGARVRMRRLMLGMSQEKLAEAIGLSFQQVQKYERGFNRMGSSRLQQMADVLQVPIPFFFEGAPDPSKKGGLAPHHAFVSDFLATAEGLALARAFMQLPSRAVRRDIVKLVNTIADFA
jgi:transcriptional regulator with XRE-family HTH domain